MARNHHINTRNAHNIHHAILQVIVRAPVNVVTAIGMIGPSVHLAVVLDTGCEGCRRAGGILNRRIRIVVLKAASVALVVIGAHSLLLAGNAKTEERRKMEQYLRRKVGPVLMSLRIVRRVWWGRTLSFGRGLRDGFGSGLRVTLG